jgi:hypothetical protein
MLEKTAHLAIGKDEEDGWVLVDEKSRKGIKLPDEAMLHLTLAIWEDCDKLDPPELVDKLVISGKVTDDQLDTVKMVVDESLSFFVEMGWALQVLQE